MGKKRGYTLGLEKMGTSSRLEAFKRRTWRLSYLSGSLGDTGSLLCESTWFVGRVYRGRRLAGSVKMF